MITFRGKHFKYLTGGDKATCPQGEVVKVAKNRGFPLIQNLKTTGTLVALLIISLMPASAQTELISNGGFESGSTSWVFSGGVGINNLAGSSAYAHTGSYYAILGGAANEVDAAYQTITIPSSATTATLSFYYNISSAEPSGVYDTFTATIRNTSGTVLATVGSWSNSNKDPAAGNPYYHQQTFNLLPYAGQTIRIYFSSVNDATYITSFRLDDVSVSVTTSSCTYSLSAYSASPSSSSGSSSFSVYSGTGCSWSAVSDSTSWLTTSSSGSGNGTVNYSYTANTSTSSRTGHITVQSQTFTVTQAGQTGSADYSGATWSPAADANFGTASRSYSNVRWIVIHTTEGTTASAVQRFQDPTQGVSAHYIVSRDGSIIQLVHNKDVSWGCGNLAYNNNCINIEHERYSTYDCTPVQYQASANLVKWLLAQYNVSIAFPSVPNGIAPADPTASSGIIGHIQVPDPSNPSLGGGASHHTDPIDWDWAGYETLITGSSPPSMSLSHSGTSIPNGDSSPTTAKGTDFGTVYYGLSSSVITFTVINNGNGALNLTGTPKVQIGGSNPSDFLLMALPSTPVTASGGSTTFQLVFEPTVSSGLRTATISIPNDDSTKNPYTFTVQGTAQVQPRVDPSLEYSGPTITNGDVNPTVAKGTDFGSVYVASQSATHSFQFYNYGTVNMALTGSYVQLSGANSGDFSIVTMPSSPIAPNAYSTIGVRFQPTGAGLRTANMLVYFDTTYALGATSPYTVALQGTGVAVTKIISLSGSLAFGTVTVGNSAQTTLMINNTGNTALTVSGISYPGGFSGAWSGPVSAGGSQPVTVTFTPSSSTTYNGTVTVNSDATSGVNTISASGTGYVPNISVTVQPSISGCSFTVDGTTYTTARVFSWVPGSGHTIATTTPQSGGTNIRYVWNSWSDGGVISHTVAPTVATNYTANFTTQYYLAMAAGSGGSASPVSEWTNSGAVVAIGATPNTGYSFSSWTGSGAGSYSGSTASTTITMNAPISETASFTLTPISVTVQPNPSGCSFSVDNTNYTTTQVFSWVPGSNHVIATTTSQSGGANVQYVWNNWSDSGAISHTVAPTTATNYTVNFTMQYFLTMNAGAGGSVNPSSRWTNSGTVVAISCTPNNGFAFNGWSGSGAGSYSGSSASTSITMNAPVIETAAFLDTNKPTIVITAPTSGQRWSNAVFTVTGTATDNVAVASVFYSLNSGGWNLATNLNNWSNWTAQATLIPGTNSIAAYSVDTSGNVSATTNVNFQYVVTNQLQLAITGLGTITPSNTWLEVGRNYSITSAPAAGFRFTNWIISTNWVGGVTVTGTNLPFMMQSNLTVQANFIDTNNPILSITNLTAGQRWSNAVFTVRGTASDNWQVANVQVQLNGGSWSTATGTTNWLADLTLIPGTNTIAAYAVDNSGNVSATTNVNFQYVVTNQLQLSLIGLGTITPTNTWLEVGRNYSITSAPAAGFRFTNWIISTNWVGGVTVTGTNLLFMMQSNLTVQANFIDTNNPILSITNLTAGQRWSNAVFTVRGTASDNWQVASVHYQLNGQAWSNATTANVWTNWYATLNLVPGTNAVAAYATDNSGNLSATSSVNFQYVVTNQLAIRTNGLGTLTPTNYSNGWLEIGRNYSITSAPATGFVFTNWTVSTNWTGGVTATGTNLLFMMQSNLTLLATFNETSRPTLLITAPANNQHLTNALAYVTGTNSDNWGVSGVWYRLNSNAWNFVATTTNRYTNWTQMVTLLSGTNTVNAYAINLGGNFSLTNSVSFVSSNTFALQLTFTNAQPMKTNGLVFTLNLSTGLNGHIQVSTNLINWNPLTNFTGSNAIITFRDPGATNSGQRFYRAVIP